MRIKALKAYLVLAENNCNFSVHKLLGIPRSNLWAYIDEIEEEVGIKLIERRKLLNTFTPEGLAFTTAARKMIETLEDIKSKVLEDDHRQVEGNIVVSTTNAIANGWLMPSIKDFLMRRK